MHTIAIWVQGANVTIKTQKTKIKKVIKSKSNQIKKGDRMFEGEQKNKKKEVNEIPYLPGESRNVHGVGCEAHAKSHG